VRAIAFDLGDRRIGVAASDPTGTIASGRDTLERSGESLPWRAILAVIEECEATHVVVGDPLHLDGTIGERARRSREFAKEVEARTGLSVELQDERLTSVQAERSLRDTHAGGGRKKNRRHAKEDVDRVAATLILQAWLDRGGSGR
jgi:putative Holliday junction resolvase